MQVQGVYPYDIRVERHMQCIALSHLQPTECFEYQEEIFLILNASRDERGIWSVNLRTAQLRVLTEETLVTPMRIVAIDLVQHIHPCVQADSA